MVYVIMSDGEMNCGTTWESAAIAKHHKLKNLKVVVDCNRLQGMGPTEDILDMGLYGKWGAFGWNTVVADGHDVQSLRAIVSLPSARPTVILAQTVKGKGVSFMEGNNDWHYRIIDKESYDLASEELGH